MKKLATSTAIHTIGLDIAKNSFSLHGFDDAGNTVLTKELRRGQVLSFFEAVPACRVGLEACASAHHWAREIAKLGHDVKLVPAQRVKAFLPRMKNDAADAKAIARAVRDPEMRFVGVKTIEQQAGLMLFKCRDLLIAQRTQLINALRGHFGEIGIVVPKGAHEVKTLVALVLREEEVPVLPPVMHQSLKSLVTMLHQLEDEIKVLNTTITRQHRNCRQSQRLAMIPGIGALTATLMVATVSEPAQFAGGREFAAWIGLVPRQHSTGGKARLGKVSKMGNRDLRRLLVVGAHAVLARMKAGKTQSGQGPLAEWARRLLAKKPFTLVAVALANKMARIAWAIMAGNQSYSANHQAAT